MSAQHTPGPWRVGPVDDTVVIDAAGNEVAAIDGDYNSPDLWPVMEANARLIAAAPDLLAACHLALNFIANTEGELGITLDSGDALRAAIAKATGAAA